MSVVGSRKPQNNTARRQCVEICASFVTHSVRFQRFLGLTSNLEQTRQMYLKLCTLGGSQRAICECRTSSFIVYLGILHVATQSAKSTGSSPSIRSICEGEEHTISQQNQPAQPDEALPLDTCVARVGLAFDHGVTTTDTAVRVVAGALRFKNTHRWNTTQPSQMFTLLCPKRF